MKKIPDNAKKMFQGEAFEIWQWEQVLFDGTKKTFEVAVRPDCSTVIAVVGDKIVVQEQEQPHLSSPYFSLPGGNFEDGDDPISCAKRELEEETGLTSDTWEEWFTVPLGFRVLCDNYFFIAKNCAGNEIQKLDGGEKITNKLLSFDEFLDLRNNPAFLNIDLVRHLERAASNSEERNKLKTLLGIN